MISSYYHRQNTLGNNEHFPDLSKMFGFSHCPPPPCAMFLYAMSSLKNDQNMKIHMCRTLMWRPGSTEYYITNVIYQQHRYCNNVLCKVYRTVALVSNEN